MRFIKELVQRAMGVFGFAVIRESTFNRLRTENPMYRAQRDACVVERDAYVVERDACVVERNSVRVERDALLADNNKLQATVQQFEKQKSITGEIDRDYQLLMLYQGMMASFDDLDPGFRPILEFVKPYTMTSVERLYDLYKSVEYLSKKGIPGDLLECGVWRGGSVMAAARTLLALGDTSRTLYLLDTYEGHPKPDAELDRDMWGNQAYAEWVNHRKTDETSTWAYVSIDEVRANMERTGYPMDKVKLVKGMVEATAATVPATAFSMVRLDTDWYESAKVGLETFWPRLTRHGLLVIDDYGHYRGQRKAVDEYFANNPVLLHRVDYSCRSIVKTD